MSTATAPRRTSEEATISVPSWTSWQALLNAKAHQQRILKETIHG
jgi:hypothetical protein